MQLPGCSQTIGRATTILFVMTPSLVADKLVGFDVIAPRDLSAPRGTLGTTSPPSMLTSTPRSATTGYAVEINRRTIHTAQRSHSLLLSPPSRLSSRKPVSPGAAQAASGKSISRPETGPAIRRQNASFQVSDRRFLHFRAQASDMWAIFPEDKNRVILTNWLVGDAGIEPATPPV